MFGVVIPRVAQACGQPPLDTRFAYTPAEVAAFGEACGAAGLAAYRDLQVLDLLYPLVAAVFFAVALLAVWSPWLQSHSRQRLWLILVPAAGMVADYVENGFAWVFLAGQGSLPDGAVAWMSLAASVKTTSGWAAGVALSVGIAFRVVRLIRSRRAAPQPPPNRDNAAGAVATAVAR